MNMQHDPGYILQTATGFWASKVPLTAVEFNLLSLAGDAFDYTGANFREWCSEVGFQRFEIIGLAGPTSAAIAYK